MEYLKTVVPSHLIAERGSNLVVINPGSSRVRIGLANQHLPFNIPHCIARFIKESTNGSKRAVQDQITPSQLLEREKAYDIVASLLKIPFLDEDTVNDPFPRKMGRIDGFNVQNSRGDAPFTWTDVRETSQCFSLEREPQEKNDANETSNELPRGNSTIDTSVESKFKEYIFGEESLRISPTEPYSVRHPIRRGHLNISHCYPTQQVLEDLCAIWEWILNEKLRIPQEDRHMFCAILVVPETFDSREIKDMLTIVLRDLRFGSAVVHQEALAAVFGNGLSTACVVNMGAQVTSVICVEDGVVVPTSGFTLPYGGEDISRCLLWVQQHHQTWPTIYTDPLIKPIDLLMLNKLKESYCQIREGEFDSVAIVHSYEDGRPAGAHRMRLSALNVPPMGLFYPLLLAPDEYPPPPRTWFLDYEDMLEETYHLEFPRKSEISDGLVLGGTSGLTMWENYPAIPTRPKEENLGLAEAVTSSILSTGRLDLQRKLFCSIQLIGGVALTHGLEAAVEERVLHAIPSNEAIDTVEVLQTRSDPTFVTWKGGAILGILDSTREAWIHREDWIRNGIHVGSGRKYKDSYFLQAQAMCYINSN